MPLIVGGDVFAGAESGSVTSTTSCGANAALFSRVASETALVAVLVSAKLTAPLPLTRGVTSNEIHPMAMLPDDAVDVGEGAGALLYVIAVSPHVLSVTPRTLNPTDEPAVA